VVRHGKAIKNRFDDRMLVGPVITLNNTREFGQDFGDDARRGFVLGMRAVRLLLELRELCLAGVGRDRLWMSALASPLRDAE
jgi:hypothetical protein